MTDRILANLNASASNIAKHLAPSIVYQNRKPAKKPQTFFEEIKSTISCRDNRPYIQPDVFGKLDNICKSTDQLNYLASAVISNLERMGIKIPEPSKM